MGPRLWQLTWRDGIAVERDSRTLAERRRVTYTGEGWGLCHQRRDNRLVMSDGSARLTFRDPATFARTGSLTVTEHGQAVPWLNELVPEPMVELPATLATKLGIESGDWVKVSSARGEIEVKALVTPRMKALNIGGREVTVVWMPYNWGFQGLSTGASVNHLTIDAGDPGAGTQETKACLVNVVKAGRPARRRSTAPAP